MPYTRWNIGSPLPDIVGYGKLASRFLPRRGLSTPEEIRAFFTIGPERLHDPLLLPDMNAAVTRIKLALSRNETVGVYGDYDADGVTATCVLVRALRGWGARPVWYIPDRESDGYGLHGKALEELYRKGVSLLITVDTGVTACEAVRAANGLGMDIIVTDHHECREELPSAVAVVDPYRPDSVYPFTGLAGVGVAFKLVCAVEGQWRDPLIRFADIVALGTVADVMPVTGENRLLITQGLKSLSNPRNPGLRALMRETEVNEVTADTVGYVLAPRINAAGRVGRADTALELLLTDDPAEAGELARTLCELNLLRQAKENDILDKSLASLDESSPVLVSAGENWPVGVIGIVAAKLAERYERPAFVLSLEGGAARGSARSMRGCHLTGLLSQVSHLLEEYGGHEGAVGFTLRRDMVETFRQSLCRLCGPPPETVLEVDAEVEPEWLNTEEIRELEAFAPYGPGFPPPIFCLTRVRPVSITPIGNGKHLRAVFEKGKTRLNAVRFNQTAFPNAPLLDVAFRAEINSFRGHRQPQLRLIDVRPSE
ncbi:MAG: single-stranded-DNA-specific exonuclease RecJ [Oscillospiraceae bacterium]|jgi:single-stranded-DNA-specific exonuclease|nr:single-stranded-DNA-specific exonuclease RecJ [Oscillospiraceae bacterium]